MKKPSHAIVRAPSKSYPKCLSTHPNWHELSLQKALKQHSAYVLALKNLGLEVIELTPELSYPDACFVEDTAIIHGNKALITRIGTQSRRGEEVAIIDVLIDHFQLQQAEEPATIDGGDVIHLSDRMISGISSRTNKEGVNQLRQWLEIPVDTCTFPKMMHLKSHATYLKDDLLIVTENIARCSAFDSFTKLIVPRDEEYAANTLTIGDVTLISAGFPKTAALLHENDVETIEIEMSEFEKCNGALTCLSLLF